MNNSESAKTEIINLLAAIYGEAMANYFQTKYEKELLPHFVHNSFVLLKQNLGEYKAGEQLDQLLSRFGVSIASYD